jgi:hypothetical protein
LISIPLVKPKPLPRRHSITKSACSPNQNENRGKTKAQVKLKCVEVPNEMEINESLGNRYDAKLSSLCSDIQSDITVKINKTNGCHNDDSTIRSSHSSESEAHFTSFSSSPTKEKDVLLHGKRGLPPLPKQREKLSSEVKEIKTFRNQEIEGNRKGKTNKSCNDRMKASNRGRRNGTQPSNITENLNVFESNMDNRECVETVYSNEEPD